MNSSSIKAENHPVAIIGCGYVADYYVRSKALHPDVEIVGAFDIRRDRLGIFCEYWNLTAFDSLEALLTALPDNGVVLNLTPPAAHYDVTRACLDAGRHVYSEKPLATEVDKALELVQMAASKGLLLGGCAVLLFVQCRLNSG